MTNHDNSAEQSNDGVSRFQCSGVEMTDKRGVVRAALRFFDGDQNYLSLELRDAQSNVRFSVSIFPEVTGIEMFMAASKAPSLGIAAKADSSGLSVYDSGGALLAAIGGVHIGAGEARPDPTNGETSRLEEGTLFVRRNDVQ